MKCSSPLVPEDTQKRAVKLKAVQHADCIIGTLLSPSIYIFIHIRPRGSHDTTDIKGCRRTDHPLLFSRQRRHFGAPSGSVRTDHPLLFSRIGSSLSLSVRVDKLLRSH